MTDVGRRRPALPPVLRVYAGLVRGAVLVALTYRGRLVLWLVSAFFPLLLMAVWLTVVEQSGPPAGWTAADVVAYYAAAAVMWHLSGQHVVWEWDADLRSGDLSNRLLRPVHPFHQYCASDLGHRLVLLAMLLPALVVAALAVPALRYDVGPGRLAATAAAVVLGYAVSIVMASAVALVGFWSTQTTNLWMLWWGLGSFTSGWVAPLELMPAWLRDVAVLLPFRTTIGFPVELLSGRLDGAQVVQGFAVGSGWLAVLTAVYVAGWRRGVRRYQAVAG